MLDYLHQYFSMLLAFAMTVFTVVLLRPLAVRLKLVDIPGGRKHHHGEVPLIGGIGMFCGFSFAILTLPVSLSEVRSLLASGLLLIIIGVLDDFHELNHSIKFVAQFIAALLMAVWGGNCLHTFGNLLFMGTVHFSGVLSMLITIIASVGLMNAVNMLDGSDGLAASIVLVQCVFFLSIAQHVHATLDMHLLLIIIAIICGYLCFNFPLPIPRRRKIFMGDAGSLFLGMIISWFSIRLTQPPISSVPPVTMLWVCAIPLLDIFTTITRRLYQGHSPFRPDRVHWHHLLKQAGASPLQIILICVVLNIFCGLLGYGFYHWHFPEGVGFVSFILLYLGSLGMMRYYINRDL